MAIVEYKLGSIHLDLIQSNNSPDPPSIAIKLYRIYLWIYECAVE